MEFQALLPAVQNKDEAATQKLCRCFSLLIYDLVQQPMVYNTLGVDAVNMAYEELLKLAQSYHGPDYSKFPGLAKKVISSRLYRKCYQEKTKLEPLYSLEQQQEQGQEPAELDNSYATLEHNDSFQQLIADLPPAQRQVLYDTFYLGLTLKEQALLHKSSYASRNRLYHKALVRLKQQLQK